MKTITVIKTSLLCSLLLVAGCGKSGFAPVDMLSSSSTGTGTCTTNCSQSTVNKYANVNVKSTIQGGNYDKTLVVDIDQANDALLVVVPLAQTPFTNLSDVMGDIGTSDVPGVKLVPYSLPDGTSSIAVSIPLKYVLKGLKSQTPGTLPNGDALPAVPGEPPSFAIGVTKKNVQIYVYIGVEVVGVFVGVPIDPYLKMTLPIKDQNQMTVGYFSSVPKKSNSLGGFFLSYRLPADVSRFLDDYF